MLIFVLAIIDQKRLALPRYLIPPAIGIVIVALNCAFSYNTGLAMNPARDLGPRLFLCFAGWGKQVFR